MTKTKAWFAPSAIWANFKKIKWLPLRRRKDGRDGLLATYGKVIIFIALFALAYIVIDFILGGITSAIGIL